MAKVAAKPVDKKRQATTEKPVTGSTLPRASAYKLTKPGKDFRLIKGGWPSAKKKD
ncbi:MAG: hypothetical protein ACR2JW_15710 [Thermomicrobiales bacterium]